MPAPDVELWAQCATCNRAFFVPGTATAMREDVACPVCAEVPEHIERRSGDEVVGVHTLAPDATA